MNELFDRLKIHHAAACSQQASLFASIAATIDRECCKILVVDDPVGQPHGTAAEVAACAAMLERWCNQSKEAEYFRNGMGRRIRNASARQLGLALPPHNRSPKPLRRLKHALAYIEYYK